MVAMPRWLAPIALAVCLLLLAPAPMQGWGMDVHRFLTRRALDGLPAELAPFFAVRRDFISEHSVDPDLWRIVGLKGDLGAEDQNHYLDLDGLDAPPFKNIPRVWTAYIAKYGVDRANENGRLPWRAEEIYTRLVAAFHDVGRGTPVYAPDNVRYLAAVLAHYIEDAHVPFHATVNHDGQLTNQRGIHARFENDLVLKYLSTLNLAPVSIRPINGMRDDIFEALIVSQSLVAGVLQADRRAAAAGQPPGDAYYAAFFKEARGVVERRMSEAASSVASAIVSAWTEAGKPPLPVDGKMLRRSIPH